jgi:peptidyl-prolyl cis-trans isomerase D
MLDIVRSKQKSVFIKLAFAVIILSFVIGYAMLTSPGGGGGVQTNGPAAVVNGTQISMEEYRQAYGNLYRLYQGIYRDQFTPALEKQLNLQEQAFRQLVDRTLLLQESEKLGMSVTKQEVVNSIAAIPAFQENGVFNKQRYLQVLGYQRITPEIFETIQEQDLLVEKISAQLRGEVQVSDEEVTAEFRKQNEKVNLSFARFAPSLFEAKVEVTDEALKAFFTEQIESFRLPEKISIRYLLFDPASYEKDVVLEDAEVQKYYNRHLDLFDIPEQVRASHILIRVANDADEQTRTQKKELADKVLAEAKTGKDFGKLVQTYSDDQASVAKDGDLGYFTRGTMVAAFEKAAFDLTPGSFSEVVETPFGYHIIKGTGYIEAGVEPLEDVLDQVKDGLRKDLARQMAFEKAMDAYNINHKTGDLDAAASSNSLEIKETPLFTREEAIPGFGLLPELGNSAFALENGGMARPANLQEGVVLIALKDRQESRLPELDEVRDQVEQAYRKAQSDKLARDAAAAALAILKETKSLKDAVKKTGIKIEDTGDFTSSFGDFIPRIGQNEELSKSAFTLTSEAPAAGQVFDINGKFVIAALKTLTPADLTLLDDAKREELKKSLMTRKQDELFRARVEELKQAAVIDVSPTIVNLIDQR